MSSAAGSKGSAATGWTQRQNKQFECALAVYDRDTPHRWHDVARYMGGAKSADELRRHFERLVHDVAQIESSGRYAG
nr:protein RADIALIS-like 3 [Aegilops tauschii subsp. strangulata]